MFTCIQLRVKGSDNPRVAVRDRAPRYAAAYLSGSVLGLISGINVYMYTFSWISKYTRNIRLNVYIYFAEAVNCVL